ncbi:hypothetical protein [Undibacterium sp. Di24W]|uniref:hypothetical protein n=1 Tax=Undibacterium sp. Di24W TaxID=3413033 RepID=UPI003BEF6A54
MQGSAIPINKTYGELTVEQKATLHGYYDRIELGDEPPFPINGLKSIYEALRKAGQN